MKNIYKLMRAYFYSGSTKSCEFRINELKKLSVAIDEYEDKIIKALTLDLGKCKTESYITEIGMLKSEINEYIKHLPKFMKRKKFSSPITIQPAKSYVYPEPKGIVLIISPWNYPFLLTFSPLIAAIAAGNCAMVKPSELSPNTSKIIAEIIKKIFTADYISVFTGDKTVSDKLLDLKFDHIFFTGSTAVGKIIMASAAKNLTPVTLELGGKSPTIVDETADIKLAAKRIVWGKFLNAGQICIAPDYILCHESVKDELLKELVYWIENMYSKNPLENDEYPKIINERHFERLAALITPKKVFYGGKTDKEKLKISPTILTDITEKHASMKDEIFGPIIPVLTYTETHKMIDFVRSQPKPLALYLFTKNEQMKDMIINQISFGGATINDTLVHLLNNKLGFGGVGDSGIGKYHGLDGFKEFSHYKPLVVRSNFFDIPFRYPPFKNKLKILRFLIK